MITSSNTIHRLLPGELKEWAPTFFHPYLSSRAGCTAPLPLWLLGAHWSCVGVWFQCPGSPGLSPEGEWVSELVLRAGVPESHMHGMISALTLLTSTLSCLFPTCAGKHPRCSQEETLNWQWFSWGGNLMSCWVWMSLPTPGHPHVHIFLFHALGPG